MPTKPVSSFVFATDANFSSGPATGFPTKIIPGSLPQGFIPGTGINAEWANYLFNILGEWVTDWLLAGTFDPDLDAHLVETDSTGTLKAAQSEFGGTAGTAFALVADENSGAPFITALLSNATNGSTTVDAQNSSLDGTGGVVARFTQNLDGLALDVLSGGDGAEIIAGGSGLALNAEGGLVDGSGVRATSSGSGIGVLSFSGDSGSAGVFFGQPTSSQAPVEIYKTFLTPGTPARGTIFLDPTDEPTAPDDGDFWKIPGVGSSGRGGLEWEDADGAPEGGGAGKQRAWSTTNGLGEAYEEDDSISSTASSGALVTKLALDLGVSPSPGEPLGYYILSWYCEVSIPAGGDLASQVRVVVQDGGVDVADTANELSLLGQWKGVSGIKRIRYDGTPKSLTLKWNRVAGSGNVEIRNARLEIRGAYEDNTL